MDIVEYRNNVWNRGIPMFKIMINFLKMLPKKIVRNLYEHKRFKNGWINMAWRYAILYRLGTKFSGGYFIVQPNVYISNPDKLIAGKNITINDNSYIECKGGLYIGNDVMIGHSVSILTNSHGYEEREIAMNHQEEIVKKVVIGNNVWIGAKATILMGVTIGDNVIIGTNALVNKDVPSNAVVAGVPAKIIRYR